MATTFPPTEAKALAFIGNARPSATKAAATIISQIHTEVYTIAKKRGFPVDNLNAHQTILLGGIECRLIEMRLLELKAMEIDKRFYRLKEILSSLAIYGLDLLKNNQLNAAYDIERMYYPLTPKYTLPLPTNRIIEAIDLEGYVDGYKITNAFPGQTNLEDLIQERSCLVYTLAATLGYDISPLNDLDNLQLSVYKNLVIDDCVSILRLSIAIQSSKDILDLSVLEPIKRSTGKTFNNLDDEMELVGNYNQFIGEKYNDLFFGG